MLKLLTNSIEMDPTHADSFYVLGQLYNKLPGFPISFGNDEYAVSLARRSVALNELQAGRGIEELEYDYYMELAVYLWERNWSERKREKAISNMKVKYSSAKTVLENNFYYEGILNIPNMSDREEAIQILYFVKNEIETIQEKTIKQTDTLLEANKLVEDWE